MKAKNIITYLILLSGGVFLGWLLFGSSENHGENAGNHVQGESQVWTCSMHPQIRQDKPGKCPLCAMDLIPLKPAGISGEITDPEGIALSKEAMALADVQTAKVAKGNPVKEIRLYGTIQIDERLARSQTSHINGRIEKLLVNFTGETVKQGQVIASVYSPELLNAQQELLEAVKLSGAQPALLDAAREKLRLWKLTETQIREIEESGNTSASIDIVANTGGIVVAKKVEQGDYVAQGTALFELINLSSVWAVFDAYESDLPYLNVGDKVEYTVQAIPEKSFSGKITFISPVLDRTTRTVKVRVETANAGLQLKPEMYASATVNASLKQYSGNILIPKTAILWTGKRSIVYVKRSENGMSVFKLREVELGPSLGDSYVILSGIVEGEEIVTGGVFSIDASMQLEGKRSMMNAGNPGNPDSENRHAAIAVQGLCEMCRERIEKTAMAIAGVSLASWDMTEKRLHLDYDPAKTSADDISKAVAGSGHDTDKYRADNAVYKALPDCCKYRTIKN
ncbi:MAG: efflux RND transporter periplasmic adaptor subunit [Bacteroidales bacterium]|jgi:Cu(I)/Ag(I) efflux system membrane fusion protein|nr:efflux RND transporter periplasmic adaptor subunit [Bacteroidales bacterium]